LGEVLSDELLARFILQRNRIRYDRTVKPDAFVPHPYRELSVTRHINLDDPTIWRIGYAVAESAKKTLHGRADVRARVFAANTLQVTAAPTPSNANHANVTDWPINKAEQKSIAQKIAATVETALFPPA
jgi:hypothetical protein